MESSMTPARSIAAGPPALAVIGLLFALAAAPCPAGAQGANSLPDGPVACSDFHRSGYGSWTVLAPTAIYPRGTALPLARGQTFAPNQMFDGFEITAILDRNCGNS
jgi:hypothetical protein